MPGLVSRPKPRTIFSTPRQYRDIDNDKFGWDETQTETLGTQDEMLVRLGVEPIPGNTKHRFSWNAERTDAELT